MSLLSMLRTTGTLKRATRTKDTSGGQAAGATFATVGTADVPCDIQPASSSTVTRYMQQNMTVSHTIYLAADVAAIAGDRFDAESRKFKVQGKRPGAPGYVQWPCILDVVEDLKA